MSRNKGSRGERELAAILSELFSHKFQRTKQYCGASGDSDVRQVSDDAGIHWECKRVEKLNVHKALEQAVSDCRDGSSPVVASKKNHGEWIVHMRLCDLPDIAKKLSSLIAQADRGQRTE